jgi:hypothetical protein
MGGRARRSNQDELEQTRRDHLAFLKGMTEHAVTALRQLPKRSGSTSSSPAR